MKRALLVAAAVATAACNPFGSGEQSAPSPVAVDLRSPAAFSSDALPSTTIDFVVSRSAQLDASQADIEAAIAISPSGQPAQRVSGSWAWSMRPYGTQGSVEQHLTLTPDVPLVAGTTYVATVSPVGTFQPAQATSVPFVVGHRLALRRVDVISKQNTPGAVTKLAVYLSEAATMASVMTSARVSDGNDQMLATSVTYAVSDDFEITFTDPPPISSTLVLQVGPGLVATDGTPLVPGPETFGATATQDGGLSLTLRPSELTANGCGEDCWSWFAHL